MGNPISERTVESLSERDSDSDNDNISTEDEDDNQHETEEYAEEEEDDSEIIRAKWLYDGCESMDDIIKRLEGQIEYIKKLKNDGWELIQPVDDDYGFMRQNKA